MRGNLRTIVLILPLLLLIIWLFSFLLIGGYHPESHEILELLKEFDKK